MELVATLAFAALILAHMAAYFAVRRFYAHRSDMEDGRTRSQSRALCTGTLVEFEFPHIPVGERPLRS